MPPKQELTFKIHVTPELEALFKKAEKDLDEAEEILLAAKARYRAAKLFFIFGAIFALWGVISVLV